MIKKLNNYYICFGFIQTIIKIKDYFLYKPLITEFECDKKLFGNANYGGFYINPYILSFRGDIIVYSAGVGNDISFDIAVLSDYSNCKIFAFDPTPQSIEWVNKQYMAIILTCFSLN